MVVCLQDLEGDGLDRNLSFGGINLYHSMNMTSLFSS